MYLLRSASVYLNQNSFVKFILTMQSCIKPVENELSESSVKEGTESSVENEKVSQVNSNETQEIPFLSKDIPY